MLKNLINSIYVTKQYLCNYIGCNFMIDDREDILNEVRKSNPNIVTILFGSIAHSRKHYSALDWREVKKY